MATAFPFSPSIVLAKSTTNRLSFRLGSSSSLRPCNNDNNHRSSSTGLVSSFPLPLPSIKLPLIVSATAAAIEVEEVTTARNSSKILPIRVGHGFDLHRLEPGYPLIIGGINIPHDRGCEAHSDGDVLLHCVVDAILGALGLPDIGQIFPDNDPKWKGAASSVFVEEAVRLMNEAGYELGNLDATLILQRPKLSPHKEAMRANLSTLLGVDPSIVNLKAKTHEKVDSLGENRSIAAHTVVLLMRK
ncbi:2-C-methyl-D-erythritol 2,4-cyclodiphosphate synthase, chloroplastic-like [Macadamia integrifolia]|uniref:2-C-methyl-D-erythritol 2,4-cyclodiphosphate synthase, chloroplastic-like n=1 Tax=Macadamia integrifolia TaxID=60698 RepID=UPI001C52F66F|nr:2-C-methyl-D-erythritol 2,4-cyclodiphosphate synthase, chloroplastic-like [Macadamia integrifolia]